MGNISMQNNDGITFGELPTVNLTYGSASAQPLPGQTNITIIKADNKTLKINIVDEFGRKHSVGNFTAKFTVRENPLQSTSVIEKSTSNGIVVDQFDDKQLNIVLESADTNIDHGKYAYDIEITDWAGRKFTIMYGNFIVLHDVSR